MWRNGFFGQRWPLEFIKTFMQQTISGKVILKLEDTIIISQFFIAFIVKIPIIINNPQVTKAFNMQVGTSETIRLLSIKNINNWNEWLAGLIDGDGSFLLSKKGYASLEITMDLRDSNCLYQVKQKFGGSIKLRSGVKAIRYRLHHKSGLLFLINSVNGLIRNPSRMIQLEKICNLYKIPYIYPISLNQNNGWLAGFFDADGTITINQSNFQLSISISQKTPYLLTILANIYGGNVYIDKSRYESFKWYISKKEDIIKLIDYFKLYPSLSAKKTRLHLIPKYYKLKELKVHKAPENSLENKAWRIFLNKWMTYDING